MGQSTDAYLFYGYCWNDEGHQLLGDVDDENGENDKPEWNEIVAKNRGHVNPWDSFPPELNDYTRRAESDAWIAAHRVELDAWRAATKQAKDDYEVDISSHCSCDCPMPYIFIKESETQAWRGQAQSVNVETIIGAPIREWNDKLTKFVADLGISLEKPEYGEAPQGPGWFLVSNWC